MFFRPGAAPVPSEAGGAATVIFRPAASADPLGGAAPAAIALPPAIEAFLDEPQLKRLLTMHPIEMDGDDANFSGLSGEDVAVYFSFAGRVAPPVANPASPIGAAGASLGIDPDLPEFGPRYRVVGRFGMGGVSETFLADDIELNRRVAIKKLLPTLAGSAEWRERFVRETRLLARVTNHPNIVNIYDSGFAPGDGSPFYVMEALQGQTLEMLLRKAQPFDADAQTALLRPIFDALAHIHGVGVVHGDIKPGSIMVQPSGVPKLIDFGLAFVEDEGRDRLTSTGTIVGTPAYLSPEKLTGAPFDTRSDLFSWGAVIYECLTGRRAYGEGNMYAQIKALPPPPSHYNPALTPAMDAAVAGLLAIKPEDRFATAQAARDAFVAAITT
jgi:serine/threonine-protein kinase